MFFTMFKFKLMTPVNLSYWWNLGSMLGILVVVQIMSGLMLSFYYENSSDSFVSVMKIHMEVWNGYMLHMIHLNFSSLIFLFLFLHVLKAIYFTSFLNLKIVWTSGLFIMILMMMVSFLGYVLPWGQMSLWGATVITNLISVLPFGEFITTWVWGGYFVSINTMKVFFSLHFLIPFVILLLIMIHIILLHYMGSSNPLGVDNMSLKAEFLPNFIYKDLLNIFLVLGLVTFICFNPYFTSDPENFIMANPLLSPIHIQPEWYFLQYYAILRAIPNKVGGVIFFVLSLMMLFFMVFNYTNYSTSNLSFWKMMSMIFLNLNMVLIWLGGCPVVYPFLQISQIMTILYFFWFFTVTLITKMKF